MRDLLRLDDRPGLSASFTTDPLAEELAAMVAEDKGKLDRIAPADLPDEPEARALAFVERFGERAFRRPASGTRTSRCSTAARSSSRATIRSPPARARRSRRFCSHPISSTGSRSAPGRRRAGSSR
ncbi:hypothetical protein BE20_14350 [Sorangium cellulosum]|nr:hypothetical protein BE20_14350 [Sorangium cellulosum]